MNPHNYLHLQFYINSKKYLIKCVNTIIITTICYLQSLSLNASIVTGFAALPSISRNTILKYSTDYNCPLLEQGDVCSPPTWDYCVPLWPTLIS